jgi:GTP:adenosylcobinamide-phosphate guanylyltransferase
VEFEFLIDNTLHKISLEKKENVFIVSDGEKTYEADIRFISPHIISITYEADIRFISPHIISILIKGRSCRVYFARDREKMFLSLEGQQFIVQEPAREGHKNRCF